MKPVRLAAAEMDVVVVLDDRDSPADEAPAVGDHVEVAGALVDVAGRLDRDALGGHRECHAAGDVVTVDRRA